MAEFKYLKRDELEALVGKEVTYDEMMNSDMKLGPDVYVMGDIGFMKNAKVPVPGTLERPPKKE